MTYSPAMQYTRPGHRCAAVYLLWLVLLLFDAALPARANTLTAIDTPSASASQVRIRLTLDGTAPIPSVFTTNDPARLAIDLPDTSLSVSDRNQRVGRGAVEAINAASANGTTRVVVKLSQMVTYNLRRRGNHLLITLGKEDSRAAADNAPPPVAPAHSAADDYPANSSATAHDTPHNRPKTPSRQSTSGSATAVRDIDFRRTAGGAGQVRITLNGNNAPADVSKSNGQVVVRLPGVSLPEALHKRLDVTDFATPVKTIDALGNGHDTRIVIKPTPDADYEQLAYQTDNDLFIELQPLTPAEQEKRKQNKPEYTGEKISLSFQSVDVRKILQIIADVADVNMVVSDSVSGTMALRLDDLPWDQALDIILQSKNLGMRRVNNVITVAPLAEIVAREKAARTAQQATANLAPLHSEIFQINYAQASNLASILNSQSAQRTTPNAQAGGDNRNSLLSSRGHITVDDRTNSLLVSDTRAKLDEIRRLINHLDIPVRQVLVEARIVVANRNFSRSLGVSQSVSDQGAFESPDGGNYLTDSGYTVDLPVASPAGTISTSIIGSTFNLDLALSALESEDRGEIISSPRIITADGAKGKIDQGVEIPYLEAASSGAATVQFKEAVLSLGVTPQITPDNRVKMLLKVKQDTQGDSVNVQGGGSVPSINTRTLNTQVLVDDGDTVVLGGIYEQENRNTTNRIPVLGSIPLIGTLFRGTQKQRNKRELLLFITPKILHETLNNN